MTTTVPETAETVGRDIVNPMDSIITAKNNQVWAKTNTMMEVWKSNLLQGDFSLASKINKYIFF